MVYKDKNGPTIQHCNFKEAIIVLSNIRVIVVDDHDLVRAGLKRILSDVSDIELVAETSSGAAVLELAGKLQPDVILMDLKMPDMDGLETTRMLIKQNPNVKVLVVSVCLDELLLPRLFQEGASGYFTKSSGAEEMIRAIRTVAQGQRYISPFFAQKIVLKNKDIHELSAFDVLSERELQVVLMIIEGQTIQSISERLDINRKTINSYRSRSFQKLNVRNDVELTLLAFRQGLLKSLNETI